MDSREEVEGEREDKIFRTSADRYKPYPLDKPYPLGPTHSLSL
jgi:hypothetical protein